MSGEKLKAKWYGAVRNDNGKEYLDWSSVGPNLYTTLLKVERVSNSGFVPHPIVRIVHVDAIERAMIETIVEAVDSVGKEN